MSSKNDKKGPSAYKRAKTTVKVATVSAAVGAIIGVALGLMKAPKKGKELASDVEREAAKLWRQLKITKAQAEKSVKKIFGEVSPETLRMYAKAKSELLARVAKYKDQMDKQTFENMVDSVVKQVSRSKKMQQPLKKMAKEFKGLWKDLKKHL